MATKTRRWSGGKGVGSNGWFLPQLNNILAGKPAGPGPPGRGGFTPFVAPQRPPPGTYDPAIDAQVRAGGRGYGDMQEDFGINKGRAQDDFLIGKGELEKALGRELADLGRQRGESHADYERRKQQASEDYGSSLAGLQRSYDQRAGVQTEQATQAGVQAGGALQQALQKRMANQALDKAPIDTNFQRFNQEADLGEQRQQQEYEILAGQGDSGGRLREDAASQIGRLGLGLDRAFGDQGDQTIALARAGRENTELGTDAAAQRWYQSTQAGYDPPQPPKNEHTVNGQTYRLVRTPRGLRKLLPSGHLVGRHPAQAWDVKKLKQMGFS